jgi:hypothetical protein
LLLITAHSYSPCSHQDEGSQALASALLVSLITQPQVFGCDMVTAYEIHEEHATVFVRLRSRMIRANLSIWRIFQHQCYVGHL